MKKHDVDAYEEVINDLIRLLTNEQREQAAPILRRLKPVRARQPFWWAWSRRGD